MVLVQDDDHGIEHVMYYLSRNLLDMETRYAYVEKLALAAVCAVQRFHHYILWHTTTVISDCNLMTYILSRQLLGGKYSKWIVILQEFDLEFTTAKSKKSLVFAELLCSLPSAATSSQIEESIPDETLFLISTLDPWYGDIIVYLQTSFFHLETSKDARRRICHQAQPYRIVGDTLYRLGVDSVLRRCLTFEEAERVLNDYHSGACGGHMKDATGFTPFQLVYGLEATLPIECEIPSLKLAVELLPETTPAEEQLLYLERLDETRRLASLAIEAQKKRVKNHFDNSVNPRSFVEGDLVLLYDQASDKLGAGKLEPMWHGPYIIKRVLQKGAYELIDYEGNPLDRPRNGLYLKKYYA
eukprot:PITA_14232